MRKNAKTIAFAVFVALLVAYAYFFEFKKDKDEAQAKLAQTKIVPFEKSDVDKIELHTSSGFLLLAKENNQWQMLEPIKDMASNEAVEDFIQQLIGERYYDLIGESEHLDWSIYGLDKPKAKLVLEARDGQKLNLSLSERKNFEGMSFLKKEGLAQVMVAGMNWAGILDKQARDFRDKRVIRSSVYGVKGIEIQNTKGRTQLTLQEGVWINSDAKTWRLSDRTVHDFITALAEFRALDFATDKTPTTRELARIGLNRPQLVITLTYGEDKKFAIKLAQKEGEAFAWPQEPNWVLKVNTVQMNKWAELSADSFRDREFLFAVNPEDVQGVFIKGEPVPENKKQEIVSQVKMLRVKDFVMSEKALNDLKKAEPLVSFVDEAKNKLFELKVSPGKSGIVYAKANTYEGVFSLDKSVIEAFTLEDKPKEKAEERE